MSSSWYSGRHSTGEELSVLHLDLKAVEATVTGHALSIYDTQKTISTVTHDPMSSKTTHSTNATLYGQSFKNMSPWRVIPI